MKDCLLASLFVLTFSICVRAQSINPIAYSKKKIVSQIEVIGGLSVNFLSGGAEVDNYSPDPQDPTRGYTFGIGLIHEFNPSISLKLNCLFERKGGIINHTGQYFNEETQAYESARVSQEYKYDCYTFPIVGVYTISCFRFGVGPYISYLQKQIKVSTYSFSGGNTTDESYLNKTFDFGLSLQASAALKLNPKFSLTIGAYSNIGLINTRTISYVNDRTLKLNSVALLCGITYKR